MRVLFVTYPETTVFRYLVPLAWALRAAGNEVAVASQANFSATIAESGLSAIGAGSNPEPWRVRNLTPQRLEEERAGLPPPYDVAIAPEEATWEYLRDGYAGPVVNRYVMESVPMIDDLVDFARSWSPDLVIWEPNCVAAPIAAAVVGARHGRLLFGLDVFGVTRARFLHLQADRPAHDRYDALGEWMGKRLAPYGVGFTEELTTGQFTIDQFPDSLQLPGELVRLPMRFVPYGVPSALPGWLREPPERPRVLVTMGLSATDHFAGYPVDMAELLAGLGELDIEVVATIADRVREQLGPLPSNVRAVPYVLLEALAPTCRAAVHHAGAATLATLSLHGLPQLAIHHHFDQPAFADLLARQGAGLAMSAGEASGPAVREAVVRLLSEPVLAQRASRLREEMRALPSPNDVAAQLNELVSPNS